MTAPPTVSTAAASAPQPYPCANAPPLPSAPAPAAVTISVITQMPASPDASLARLSTPLAAPTRSGGTEASTLAVSGVVRAEPAPITAAGASRAAMPRCRADTSRTAMASSASPAATTSNPAATVRAAPSRAVSAGMNDVTRTTSSAAGRKTRPVLVAEKPASRCRKIEVQKNTPFTPAPHSTDTAIPPSIRPFSMGRPVIGVRLRQAAYARPAPQADATAAAATIRADVHPAASPSVSTNVTAARAATERARRGQPARALSSRGGSAAVNPATTSPASPAGRFTRKIQFQPRCWLIHPPRTGPRARAEAREAIHTAARASRSRAVGPDAATARAAGSARAAPAPCAPRASSSTAAVRAIPAMTEAAVKAPSPSRRAVRVP
jgi:hypothetical protein